MAAICSKAVYEPNERPTIPRHSIQMVHALKPSIDGTVKASAIYVVERISIDAGRTTTIVLSIRGSKSIMDWMVNSNDRGSDASNFIDMDTLQALTGTQSSGPLLVHRGFLLAAREMIPRIKVEFEAVMKKNPGSVDVIFTGHSAGGGVASLLFAHFFSYALTKYDVLNSPHVRLSCITFGAPPIFSEDILPTFYSFPPDLIGKGLMLAIINEGDPVPRSCETYVNKVLLQLLRKDVDGHDSSMTKNPSKTIGSLLSGRSRKIAAAKQRYSLPVLDLYALGDLVVLRDRNADGEAGVEEDLHAAVLRKQDLEKLLFANFFAHQKDEYVDVAGKLAKGEFNGRRGWVRCSIGW
jgi:Lipase (class 3)